MSAVEMATDYPRVARWHPVAKGEMSRLIAQKDWSLTPLGPIEQWPIALKLMVNIMLNHPLPAAIFWGPELIQLYNDGSAEFSRDKHPETLGIGNEQAWPEAWSVNQPIFARVMEGESLTFVDQLFPLFRNGNLEDAYVTLSYCPIPDETGKIVGAFVTLLETTEKVVAQKEHARYEQESIRIATERERLQREIEIRSQLLSDAVKHSPAFMCVLRGPEHVYELTNGPYEKVTGYRQVLGRAVREAFPEVEGQGFFELLDTVYRTGEPFIGEKLFTVYRTPGALPDERWLEIVYQPIRNEDGEVSGILVQGNDLTERRNAEQERNRLFLAESTERAAREGLEKVNSAKDDFIAVLSHELRTPLTAILGWSYMLEESADDPIAVRHAAAVIERNARAQAQLVDDLLDIARIQSGKIRLEQSPIDTAAVIETAIETIRVAANEKRIEIKTDIAASSSAGSSPSTNTIIGDETRLRQIVVNLLSNAVKFTPDGGSIFIETEVLNGRLAISIRDTGVGIDPVFLPYVFERFSQAESSMLREHGGLGLGLSIVKGLVELHEGTVHATSEGSGQGCTFTVRLPLALAHTQ